MENQQVNSALINPSDPSVIPSPHSNSKMPFVLGGFLLLLLVGGGAYYLGIQNNQTVTPAQNIQPTPTVSSQDNNIISPTDTPVVPTNTPVVTQSAKNDEAAGWETYSSSVLSFKYPGTLQLEERQKNYIVLLSDKNNPQTVLISIDARQTGSYANYENAVTSTKAGLTDVQSEAMPGGVKISGKINGQPITIALFKNGTAAIAAETTNQNELEMFNKIISTFTLNK